MTPTIGSLCTGYGGLDQAAERVTGGTTVWLCEFDDAPSLLLEHRYPGLPNFGDLKALEWVRHWVRILTAGYPCQPFSGAGKRLGTEDPRHLFPWIARGVEQMRPELLLLENVRGHLTLGFDTVLAELDRIGYDVRWTLLRASDIGAPHGRARLWIAARAREVGGWPTPTGTPTARIIDATWVEADDGLFGAMPLPVNKNGSVPFWPAGALVNGEVWETATSTATAPGLLFPTPEAKLSDSGPDYARATRPGSGGDDLTTTVHRAFAPTEGLLLPTPKTGPNRASRGALTGTGPGCDNGGAGQWSAPQLEQALEFARGELPREYDSWDEVRGAHAALLPTPTSRDHKGPNQRGDDTCLHGALLPTPRATDGTKGGPNQRGSSGDLMLPSAVQQLLPTPTSAAGLGGNLSRSGARGEELLLPGIAKAQAQGRLLPTPAATDGRGARNSTSGRQPGSQHHTGDTLGDLVYDGRIGEALLPTPNPFHLDNNETPDGWLERRAEVQARTGTRHGPALPVVALSVAEGSPLVQDGRGPHREPATGDPWGPYAAAVARWERLHRPAPPPTTGRWVNTRTCQVCGAPDWLHHMSACLGDWQKWTERLSPAFVEWMQGLLDGWVTSVPGLTRNQMLTMLGNGVVPQCAAVAYAQLGVSPDLWAEVAA